MRLFIQDCGVACALGADKVAVSAALVAGRSDTLTTRTDLIPERPVLVGAVDAQLPEPPSAAENLDCRNNRLMLHVLRQIDPSIRTAIERFGAHRIAVVLGTSTAGIAEGERAMAALHATGHWPTGFHYRQQEIGNLGAFAASALGLTGPAYTVTTACSSSAKVFASARRLMKAGLADAVIVGGADTLCRMTVNGFAALEALSPTRCNPFSVNRDGITIGEGAAAFLLTKDATPVELLGVGESSDAHHPTAPHPEGAGAALAMRRALADAGLVPEDIAYVNLHGTATPLNDAMESQAVADVLGGAVACSSTKGMTGHMLGAAGGVEAAFLWLALHPGFSIGLLPPQVWDGQPDPALPALNLIAAGTPIPRRERVAMLSNSFGFGGSNVALILGRR